VGNCFLRSPLGNWCAESGISALVIEVTARPRVMRVDTREAAEPDRRMAHCGKVARPGTRTGILKTWESSVEYGNS
jgi:hypothetical protein